MLENHKGHIGFIRMRCAHCLGFSLVSEEMDCEWCGHILSAYAREGDGPYGSVLISWILHGPAFEISLGTDDKITAAHIARIQEWTGTKWGG